MIDTPAGNVDAISPCTDPFDGFDPERGNIIREPESSLTHSWVGAPGAFKDPDTQTIYLTYRRRNPRGSAHERGHVACIAKSTDGVHFEDVWSVQKDQLGTSSMERFCLRRRGNMWLLYLSYVDPDDNRWRVDVVTADQPDDFDVAKRRPALTAAASGTEGVKDPYLVSVGPVWLMFASYVVCQTDSDEKRKAIHDNGDAYTTGDVTAPTGLATSLDGVAFSWHGPVLPVGSGWDRYQARLTTCVPVSGGYLGFYDGSSSADENYEERAGLALSTTLERWIRLTPTGPRLSSRAGSLRYVDHVLADEQLFLYYEYARPDGSHDLRMSSIPFTTG